MTEWPLLYALGFFFMAGQKSLILMGLADGIIVSHNKSFLVLSLLFDLVFWFLALPLQFTSYWRNKSRDGTVVTGALDLPFQSSLSNPQRPCQNCGSSSIVTTRVCNECEEHEYIL